MFVSRITCRVLSLFHLSSMWTASSVLLTQRRTFSLSTIVRSMATSGTTEHMRADCLDIVKAAIEAVDPTNAIRANFQVRDDAIVVGNSSDDKTRYSLENYDKVCVVAFGKASSAMASTVVSQLRETGIETTGLCIVKDDHATADEHDTLHQAGIPVREASHPVPDQRSVEASLELLRTVEASSSPRTLLVACISGGGSALFCAPHPALSLQDLQETNRVLLQSGLSIQDMNVIRKRLDIGKGGRLATRAGGDMVSLILSDVLGDPLDLIASGPTVPDSSSFADAWKLAAPLRESLRTPVVALLEEGFVKGVQDSPSSDHPVFARSRNVLVGNNAIAVQSAARHAQELGYHPVVLGTQVEGEAKEVAHMYVAMMEHLESENPFDSVAKLPAAIIAGGETTVSIPAGCKGKGGRNQELALCAALLMRQKGIRRSVLASVGTDGTDGPTDAAGAIVDGSTVEQLGADAKENLKDHNAYNYFIRDMTNSTSSLVRVRSL